MEDYDWTVSNYPTTKFHVHYLRSNLIGSNNGELNNEKAYQVSGRYQWSWGLFLTFSIIVCHQELQPVLVRNCPHFYKIRKTNPTFNQDQAVYLWLRKQKRRSNGLHFASKNVSLSEVTADSFLNQKVIHFPPSIIFTFKVFIFGTVIAFFLLLFFRKTLA